MKCPKCQADNREGVKFCEECGAGMEAVCPSCGQTVPLGKKFCGECGHYLTEPAETAPVDYDRPESYTPKFLADKIITTRSSIEGERKLVTVLFADVANFTSLSEKLDPEEVHQIMDAFFKIVMDEIHKYEGTINQFTGDGVMALFGAPLAHEDHAQRACHAALSIQRAMNEYGGKIKKEHGAEFKMRMGLNSGPVIVASIGDDLRMDYTAVGDTTNLAARVQQAAMPGEVWLSQETHNIIQDYFQSESVGDIDLKGKAQPQSLYRVLSERTGVRTRMDAGLVRGMTELVGRRPEMEALTAAFDRVKGGEAQVVDVVGEAGVGKSRLVYEFKQSLGNDATFFTGLCIHYGGSINFLPVIDVVRAAFGIEEGMSEEEAGRRMEENAADGLGAMVPFYRNLLSLTVEDDMFNSLNPEGRKFGTFEAVKDLLLDLSEEKPVVVFLEDVHWMDNISEEFFAYFSRCITDQSILMLSAYRPEGVPSWAQGPHYQRLGLETLSIDSSIRLVQNMLGGLALEPVLEGKIAEKTGGNPFFVEEIVKELLEQGELIKEGNRYVCKMPIDQCEIPNTVQGVLAARMDRMSDDLKRTMQVASVIGRDFAFQLLRSIMELGEELRARLTNLVGLEIIYEKALYPELEYIFKHALTQEVAYESLLKQRRRELHGRIARTIEEIYADRLEQHYEVLAHHYELSDNPGKAIEYLVLAGEKSNRSLAANTAVDFFTRALNKIEQSEEAPDPDLMKKIRVGRANPYQAMGKVEESMEDYQEAIELARATGDQRLELSCLTEIPFVIWDTTLHDKMPQFCEQGLELASTLGDQGAEASIIATDAAINHLWAYSDGYETIQKALKIAEESGQPEAIGTGRMFLSLVERWRGNPQRALELTEGMVEELQSVFNIFVASAISAVRGFALTGVGRYSDAIQFQSEWIDIFERSANYTMLTRSYNGQGWTYSEVYDLEKASHFNNRALENSVNLEKSPAFLPHALHMQANAEANLADDELEMGKVDEAWERITRLDNVSANPNYGFDRFHWSNRMKNLKGTILIGRGDLDSAEELAQQCLEDATKWKYKKYVGKAERLFGRVLTERGDHDASETRFRDALANLEEVGNPKQLWITHTALARLYEKMKRPDLQREQWNAAAAIVSSTADDLQDEALRSTFLYAAPVREIMDNSDI